jgi:cytoskeleton protein RodZ
MALRKRSVDDKIPGASLNVVDAPMVQRRLAVNEILKARRLECGLELAHVAEMLRIRGAILVAIEEGDFAQLPGPAYAVGFVRSYAAYLGLDAESLVIRFKAEAAEVSRRPQLSFPLPISDSRVPTGPLLIICLFLAALTYGGWYYFSATPGQIADIVPTVPERLRHLLPPEQVAKQMAGDQTETSQPAGPAPGQQPVAVAAPATVTASPGAGAAAPAAASGPPPPATDGVPPVEDKSIVAQASGGLPAAPDLTQPARTEPARPQPTSYGAPDGETRVVLRASADSWVQVRDHSGNLLFTRVLKAGEYYNVPNQSGLTLIAGNAGGVNIAVDGVAVGPIGEPGRVARNVSLDPDHLLGLRPHAN